MEKRQFILAAKVGFYCRDLIELNDISLIAAFDPEFNPELRQ
jgi:hypothetical protein